MPRLTTSQFLCILIPLVWGIFALGDAFGPSGYREWTVPTAAFLCVILHVVFVPEREGGAVSSHTPPVLKVQDDDPSIYRHGL